MTDWRNSLRAARVGDSHQVEGRDVRLQRLFGDGSCAVAADIGGGDVEQDWVPKACSKLEQMMRALCVRADGIVKPPLEIDLGGEVDDEVHFRSEHLKGIRG